MSDNKQMPQPIWPRPSAVVTAVRRQLKQTLKATKAPTTQPRAAVHKCRKGGKRLRSLLALLEPAYGAEAVRAEHRLRKAAQKLSAFRDATARVQTLDRLITAAPEKAEAKALRALRRLMVAHDSYALDRAAVDRALTRFHGVLNRVLADVGGWPQAVPDRGTMREGLRASYRLTRRAFRQALRTPDADGLHAWRKRLQHFRHQMRLLVPRGEAGLAARVALVDAVSDYLGEDHDLHVLTEFIHGGVFDLPPDVRAAFDAAAAREGIRLRDAAFAAGGTLFWRKPKAFIMLMDAGTGL